MGQRTVVGMVAFLAIPLFAFGIGLGDAHATATFDTTLEGWTVIGLPNPPGPPGAGGTVAHVAAGGNPGGYMKATDTSGTLGLDVAAPVAFLGGTVPVDLSIYCGIRFDEWLPPGAVGSVRVGIRSGTNHFDSAQIPNPPSGWVTRFISFNQTLGGWTGVGAYSAVLAAVDTLTLNPDVVVGATVDGEAAIDNVALVTCVCGDDTVDQSSEECDGADDAACPDACLPDCTCAVCGDAIVDPPIEQCDGTADAACPGLCRPNCRCPACGDDAVNQGSEQCDGTDDAACPNACLPDCTCAVCGNGVADLPVEECDGAADAACPGACLPNCRCPACGDGLVNQPSEQCDDGNTWNGDCCSATCVVETCAPCEACSIGIGCVATPRLGCHQRDFHPAILKIKDVANNALDTIVWKWDHPQYPTNFGDPLLTDDYTLCIYEQSPSTSLLFRARAPHGGICPPPATNACWISQPNKFRYRDIPQRTPDGIEILELKKGSAVKFQGKGSNLSGRPFGLPAPPLSLPLLVQLHNAGNAECWESRHSTAYQNQPGSFKSKSD